MPALADSSDSGPDLGDLMHVAFRRLRRGWTEQLAPFDLTPYQFRALQAVARLPHGHDPAVRAANPGGECAEGAIGPEAAVDAAADAVADAAVGPEPAASPVPVSRPASTKGLRLKDLAERLRIAPRSATEVVDQLEQKGLVERRPDPADRRATRIVLTAAGEQVRAEVREVRRRQAGDYFSVLSPGDRAELVRLLTELVRAHP